MFINTNHNKVLSFLNYDFDKIHVLLPHIPEDLCMSCNLVLLRYKEAHDLVQSLLVFLHVVSLLNRYWMEAFFYYYYSVRYSLKYQGASLFCNVFVIFCVCVYIAASYRYLFITHITTHSIMVLCVLYFGTIFYNFLNSSFLLKEYMIHQKVSEMNMNIAKKESTQKLNHWEMKKVHGNIHIPSLHWLAGLRFKHSLLRHMQQ